LKQERWVKGESFWGIIFVVPIMALFICFFFIPLLISIGASFTDWNVLSRTTNFVGGINFIALVSDFKFIKAIGNTIYMLIPIPIYMTLALLFALACNREVPGNKIYKVIYYLPYVSSIVALVILWQWLFNSEYGLVNHAFTTITGMRGPNWLGEPQWIKRTIAIMISWKMIGPTSIYYLAALKKIPQSYYESAKLDGATPFQVFTRITFPLITPTTFFLVIVGLIGSLQTFVEVQLFTSDGGRGYGVGTVVYYIWEKAFKYNEMGYACSMAMLFGLIILLITILQFKISKNWVYEED
jgi:ABC-type sugar transport systems, permease components